MMIVFIITLACIVFCSLNKRENEHTFLYKKQTTSVNGIFVILIFCSHCSQYITLSNGAIDSLYRHVQNIHNQWVVATFLAFSGYGVMKQLQAYKEEYISTFPKKRLLRTLINYDIAILFYLLANSILNIEYKPIEILGSFIGITGIGNSNWYIFTILVMYSVTYLAARFCKNNCFMIACTVTVCAFLYLLISHLMGLPSRFVSTVVTYALGMWIALYSQSIRFVFKEQAMVSLFVIMLLIIATYKLRANDYIMNISSCFFVLLIVWLMSKYEIKSNILHFLGVHAFSIYILQRLPMIVFSRKLSLDGYMKYVFVVMCFVTTLIIAVIYDKALCRIDKWIVKE